LLSRGYVEGGHNPDAHEKTGHAIGNTPVIMPLKVQAMPFLMLRIIMPHKILPTLQIVNGRCLLFKYYDVIVRPERRGPEASGQSEKLTIYKIRSHSYRVILTAVNKLFVVFEAGYYISILNT
jgi:hypothetical protein